MFLPAFAKEIATWYTYFISYLPLTRVVSFESIYSARKALGQCLPDQLRDGTFTQILQDDKSTKQWLQMLIKNLELGAAQQGPGADPRQIGMSPLGS